MNWFLDSSLEAFAFNYLDFGFFAVVNRLWTWVAVVTAAVSFWRLRYATAAGCPKPVSVGRTSNGSDSAAEVASNENMREDEASAAEEEEAAKGEAPTTSRPEVVGRNEDADGVTKGKFVVYYEDDGQSEFDEWTAMVESDSEGGRRSDGWWENWENLLKMRMGENGWYSYQDLTKLNGNVVRFWDGGFGAFGEEYGYRYRRSCVNVVW